MQFEQIAEDIVTNQTNYTLLTGREGIGKSFLAFHIQKLLYKGKFDILNTIPIVILCKSYEQVYEKLTWIKSINPTLKIQVALSPGQKVKEQGIKPLYRARSVENLAGDMFNKEATIDNCTSEADILFVENATTDIFRSDVDIILSVFAQHGQVHNLEKAYVFIDDVQFNDVNQNIWIKNSNPKTNVAIQKMGLTKQTTDFGCDFIERPIKYSMQSIHPTIFSTTELIVQQTVLKNFKDVAHYVINKEMPISDIKIIFSPVVNASYGHNCIPLAIREANLNGSNSILVGDGMITSDFNHTTIKGRNDLSNYAIVVDMSYLHPDISSEIQIEFPEYSRNDINQMFLIDQLHQALGRNQGHRYKSGNETIVIANPDFFNIIKDHLEYNYIAVHPGNYEVSKLVNKAGFELLPKVSNTPLFNSIYNLCAEDFSIERQGQIFRMERTTKCFIIKWFIRKTDNRFNVLDLLDVFDKDQKLEFIEDINKLLNNHVANKCVETEARKRKKKHNNADEEIDLLNELLLQILLLINGGILLNL